MTAHASGSEGELEVTALNEYTPPTVATTATATRRVVFRPPTRPGMLPTLANPAQAFRQVARIHVNRQWLKEIEQVEGASASVPLSISSTSGIWHRTTAIH